MDKELKAKDEGLRSKKCLRLRTTGLRLRMKGMRFRIKG